MEIKELLEISNKYQDNLISHNELVSFLDGELVVRKHITLSKKHYMLKCLNSDLVINGIRSDDNMEYIYNLEMLKFFNIFLSYTDIVLEEKDKCIEVYELLEIIGLEEYIYNKSRYDIDKMLAMFNELIIRNEVENLKEELSYSDTELMSNNIDKISELFKDKENMELMSKFMSFNNKKLDEDIKKINKLKKKS